MLSVHTWLQRSDMPARMIMQVHDELVFEVDRNSAEALRDQVMDLMSGAAELAVPLKVDAGIGDNWDEAH